MLTNNAVQLGRPPFQRVDGKAIIKNITKHAYEDKGGTKYCITEADRKKGIHTIFQKLEHDCPNFARMDMLFGHRQGVNTDFVEEPPMNDDETDDGEEEGNSMTNETNLDNIITEMSNENNIRDLSFTSSSASVGSSTKRKLSNDSSHSLTKKVLDEKRYRSSGVTGDFAKYKSTELEFKKEKFQLDQSMAVDRLTFDKSAAKEEMDFKRWALTQDHKQKLKQAKEGSKRQMLSSIMMTLIQQNKGPEEVNAYLDIVKKQFDDSDDDDDDDYPASASKY